MLLKNIKDLKIIRQQIKKYPSHFKLKIRLKEKIIILIILSLIVSCKQEALQICDDNIGLKDLTNIKIGSAIDKFYLENNASYREKVIKHFDRISMENAWLWYKVHPEKDVYNWEEFDYLVSFAEQYNKDIIGHSLVYHDYLPQWVNDFNGTKNDWEEILKNHIQTLIGRYKGRIKAWIVVNEAFNSDGTLRSSVWLKHIGPQYIELAFKWAREADPTAKLFYNDFDLELNQTKLKAVLRTMKDLKVNGTPIDGIGTQLHINKEFPEVFEIYRMTKQIQDEGWLVYFSEIDISLNLLGKTNIPTTHDLMQQKYLVKEIIRAFKQINPEQQYGISFWNVGDQDSWIRYTFHRIDFPCMFDDNYKAKPMYCGVKEALTE